MSICCKNIGFLDMATYYANKSIKYARENNESINSLWQHGIVCMETNRKKQAIKSFEICLGYYRNTNEKILKYNTFCNIAILKNRGNILKLLINAYHSIPKEVYEANFIIKDNLIQEVYEGLFKVYINKKEYDKASYILHNNITDENIKNKLSQHLLQAKAV
jgi:tetratricopeptide (TPR) repeat protein